MRTVFDTGSTCQSPEILDSWLYAFIVDSSYVKEQRWKSVELPNVLYILSVVESRREIVKIPRLKIGVEIMGVVLCPGQGCSAKVDAHDVAFALDNVLNPPVWIRGGPMQRRPVALR